ncbi:MAG: hypothetical protein WC686_04640 [Candidatus Shapirobacteria bacterium]|jgi:hypothetical protein
MNWKKIISRRNALAFIIFLIGLPWGTGVPGLANFPWSKPPILVWANLLVIFYMDTLWIIFYPILWIIGTLEILRLENNNTILLIIYLILLTGYSCGLAFLIDSLLKGISKILRQNEKKVK